MLHAKFQDHRTCGSGEDFLRFLPFIIYKVVKYRKVLLIYNVYFMFSLVKI